MKRNMTGILPSNGHRIQGRSSEDFLSADDILQQLDLKGNESFMDAGCGDGHIAIRALDYLGDGEVYALDVYGPSVEDMEKYRQENNVTNLIPVLSDISYRIDLEDEALDVVLLVNVFHGFRAAGTVDEAIEELCRVIKADGGRIAVMDYKKQDVRHGPPTAMRTSSQEMEEIFKAHGLKMTYLNDNTGEDIPEGKSHYLIIFERE